MDLLQIVATLDGLPLHSLLIAALIILWRDNGKLRDKIDSLHEKVDINANQMSHQSAILARVAGDAPQTPHNP